MKDRWRLVCAVWLALALVGLAGVVGRSDALSIPGPRPSRPQDTLVLSACRVPHCRCWGRPLVSYFGHLPIG